MFPGDRVDYEPAKATNKYKHIKRFLLLVASGAFFMIVSWSSLINYLTAIYTPVSSIPISGKKMIKAKKEDIGAKNSVAGIRFFGNDKSNQPYLLIADSGEETKSGTVFMVKPHLTLNLSCGNIVTLSSLQGHYDKNKELINLIGEVIVTHSIGYQFMTSLAWIDLSQSTAYGEKPIQGEGLVGIINANGGFQLSNKGDKIIFKGRPELVLKAKNKQ